MKHRIAHIINVTELNEPQKAAYLHIAQPVTMQSMIVAQRAAAQVAEVNLFAIKNRGEKVTIPLEFNWAPDIEKYAWEYIDSLKEDQLHKALPRLVDILQGLYDASDAEYFIFTNVDIGLFPNFYIRVNEILNSGVDGFMINRRTLSKDYYGITIDETNFELCYLLDGDVHGGVDCFIFRRDFFPRFNLRDVFVGFPPIGHVLSSEIKRNATKFDWIKHERLTFHLGNDRTWRDTPSKYAIENRKQGEGLWVPGKKPSGLVRKFRFYRFKVLRRLARIFYD